MEALTRAEQILTTLLGHLAVEAEITREETPHGPGLQILTPSSQRLIGPEGERLDDLQYLVNRVLREQVPDAPRIRVDCDNHRTKEESALQQEVLAAAEQARRTGRPQKLRPLNSYYRRLVYQFLSQHPDITPTSPNKPARYKKITLTPQSRS